MKLSSSSKYRSNNGNGSSSSSRFFKSAVLCALAYTFGLYSRDFNSNSFVLLNDDLPLGSSTSTTNNNKVNTEKSHNNKKSNTAVSSAPEPKRRVKSRQAQQSLPFSIPDALNVIPNDQLQLLDYFSDSWLLNKKNFLKVPLSQIGIVEDACFAAIGKRQIHAHSKMFVDWTDFMVMHLSKWWGELNILGDEDSTMFDHTTKTIFGGYLNKILTKNPQQLSTKSPLHPTIAMIAFAPYKSRHGNRGELLTAHALASTIASLYQVGFGRVIVTCNGETDDEARAHEAFRLVHLYATAKDETSKIDAESIFTNTDQIPIRIGNTELAAVKIANQTWFTTKWVKYNMPLAAVKGMKHALGGTFEDPAETKRWLGNKHDESYWKYVYLTEPDTLLHTKESMWKPIQDGLDLGLSFFPHRLQPLPHEVNLPPISSGADIMDDPPNHQKTTTTKHVSKGYKSNYLPNNVLPFSNITNLDENWHCCDGGSEWPGRSEEFGTRQQPCGYWWWGCGYRARNQKAVLEQTKEEVLENHKRLVPYPMMTIAKGTGVVFGPTEMGRRCFPSRTPCKRSEP